MKKLAIVVFVTLFMSASCKHTVDPVVVQDLMIQILTQGEWSVTEYKLNGVDKTTDFSGWRFKFYESKSVEAKFNTNVMNTGTWDGSQTTMTFSASFPSTTAPIPLVNGTWHVDTPGTRVVVSSQTSGTDVKTMKLYRE